MKEIIINSEKHRTKTVLVDDDDYEFLIQWKWCLAIRKRAVYAKRRCGKGTVFMHRALLNINDKKLFADHRDANGLNNQRSNLRIATSSENNHNRRSFGKYKGVQKNVKKYKDKTYIYWMAKIGINNKILHIGMFKSEIDAATAYNQKAIELHGEFANLNNIACGG